VHVAHPQLHVSASAHLHVLTDRHVVQVAREVYNTCLMGALGSKTRILVTNQLQFVSGANSVVYMQDGKIQEKGTYDELMKSDKGFAQLMSSAEVMHVST